MKCLTRQGLTPLLRRSSLRKLKVVTIVGTRPEIIRLSRVMSVLDRDHDHILLHTGQNFDRELSEVFFEDLNLRPPDRYLSAARNNATQTIAAVLSSCDEVLREIKPDAVLVLGDTNSCLGLLAAKKLRIPTFHMEAGNRCFDFRVPEETNRRLVDHLADVNLPYSQIARQYLLSEGIAPDRVIVTGSPMGEVLHHYHERILASNVMNELGLKENSFFLVSLHREENLEEPGRLASFISMFNVLADQHELPVIFSTHPRTRRAIEEQELQVHPQIRLLKPLSFTDYVNLQINSRLVLSDSGTISEEASILGLRAVNLRESHERPEAMEETVVMMVGNNINRLMSAIEILEYQGKRENSVINKPWDYAATNVSEKISRILVSYTDYVNRTVWHNLYGPSGG